MSKTLFSALLVGALAITSVRPAHAQFAVIDIASITQLINEVQWLEQQVQTAKSQLSQAQSEYAAITGGRGMEQLLSGTVRNYLPTDWTQVAQVLNGSSGSYPALASQLGALITANAILTSSQVNALTANQQAQLLAARQSPALLQTLSRSALSNTSDRFTTLQQLIAALGSATDQKGSLDLTARIVAEQAMLQNESTKLQGLYQMAESQEWARKQQLREQAIADQGSLRQQPAMGL
jgi:type IV secretion system protein VirB5